MRAGSSASISCGVARRPATTSSRPSHADLDVADRDAVLGAVVVAASRRRHQLRGVDRRRCLRKRSRHGHSPTTDSPCAGSPRAATAPAPDSCRSAPTTSSTARSIGRTTSGTNRRHRASTARRSLTGEREALTLGPSATVVRTSWVCGQHGANMVKTIMRLAARAAASWRSSTTRSATRRSRPTSHR